MDCDPHALSTSLPLQPVTPRVNGVAACNVGPKDHELFESKEEFLYILYVVVSHSLNVGWINEGLKTGLCVTWALASRRMDSRGQ